MKKVAGTKKETISSIRISTQAKQNKKKAASNSHNNHEIKTTGKQKSKSSSKNIKQQPVGQNTSNACVRMPLFLLCMQTELPSVSNPQQIRAEYI